MQSRCLGYPHVLISFSYVKRSFRRDSRKCGALFPKKQLLYYSKKNISCICPVPRVPSCVHCHVRCPMSHPVRHALCPVPYPVSYVPCPMYRPLPYVLLGGYVKTQTLGSLVLGPLHCPCGGLCFRQTNEATNPCTKVYLGRMYQTFV